MAVSILLSGRTATAAPPEAQARSSPGVGFASTVGLRWYTAQFKLPGSLGLLDASGVIRSLGLQFTMGATFLDRQLHLMALGSLDTSKGGLPDQQVRYLTWTLGLQGRYYFFPLDGDGDLVPLVAVGFEGGRIDAYYETASTNSRTGVFSFTASGGVEFDAARSFGIGMLLGLNVNHIWTIAPDNDASTDALSVLLELYVAFRS